MKMQAKPSGHDFRSGQLTNVLADHLHLGYHQAAYLGVVHGDLLQVSLQPSYPIHILIAVLVIQELMQTDLHRVIRTQHLTDDHCQATNPPHRSYLFLI
jgi:acyl carrier protein phosphodiesterase